METNQPRLLPSRRFAIITAILAVAAALFVVLVNHQTAHAALPPSTMNFQGRLTSPSGNIMPDGQYNMQFRIYSSASGGTALWSETRQTTARVQLTNGLFSTQLGEVTPLPASVFNTADLFFEITMATPATATCDTGGCASWESPMTPRNKLATSAYAFNSATLNGLTSASFAPATGSASYIQNTTTAQAGASFNVAGSGRVGGAFTAASTSTFGGAMTANNTAAFRTTSATAFRIQNTGGTATLFTADTTNSIIQIGSATADTTAVRLVLDSSSSATDPTGINGAMYYSSSRGKMRCYEDGAWRNCNTIKGTTSAQSSNYTARDGDFVIADASTGSFTITLPAPTPNATVSVKKVNAGNTVTVTCPTAQIDDLTAHQLNSQWHSQDYFSDGTRWYRV